MKKTIKLMASITVLALVACAVLAATPWQQKNTAATNNWTYTNNKDYVGLTITKLLCSESDTTNVLMVVNSGVTNTLATVVSNSLYTVTNSPVLFKNDAIVVTSSYNTAHTVIIQGTQEP